MLPVPGPISKATSVGRSPDLSTIEVIIIGFLRMCWPKSLLNIIPRRFNGNFKSLEVQLRFSETLPCFATSLCCLNFFSDFIFGIFRSCLEATRVKTLGYDSVIF